MVMPACSREGTVFAALLSGSQKTLQEKLVMAKQGILERLALKATEWSGSSWAFAIATGTILVWLVSGPFFEFSDTWQLVINTGTTIVTFLMVFLIQRSQNKESLAVQLKLNEIVAALQGASNRLINVEDLAENDVRVLHHHYERLGQLAKKDGSLQKSHSVEEAEHRHDEKRPTSVRRRRRRAH
jgi:low affinity Fe/Cu permease